MKLSKSFLATLFVLNMICLIIAVASNTANWVTVFNLLAAILALRDILNYEK